MEYLPRTYSVLSVAAAEKFHTSLRELLPGGRYAPVQFAYAADDAAMHGAPVRHAGAPAAHGAEKSFHGG